MDWCIFSPKNRPTGRNLIQTYLTAWYDQTYVIIPHFYLFIIDLSHTIEIACVIFYAHWTFIYCWVESQKRFMVSRSLNLSLKRPFCPSYLNDRSASKRALRTRSNIMASNLLIRKCFLYLLIYIQWHSPEFFLKGARNSWS